MYHHYTGEHLREECLEISCDNVSSIPSISVVNGSTASIAGIPTNSSIAPVAVTLSPPLVPMVRKRCLRKKRFPSVDPSRNLAGIPQSSEPTSNLTDKNLFFAGNSSMTSSNDTLTFTFSVYTLTRLLIMMFVFFNFIYIYISDKLLSYSNN